MIAKKQREAIAGRADSIAMGHRARYRHNQSKKAFHRIKAYKQLHIFTVFFGRCRNRNAGASVLTSSKMNNLHISPLLIKILGKEPSMAKMRSVLAT